MTGAAREGIIHDMRGFGFRRALGRIALSVTLVAGASVRASAGAEIELSTLLPGAGQGNDWRTWTFAADDMVSSLNSLSAGLALHGHQTLGLSDAGVAARLGYMLIAGQANARAQWANSILFGHELVHFQHAHRFGRTDHVLVDGDGHEIALAEAWFKLFIAGEIGGPARSRLDDGGRLADDEDTHGIMSNNAGLNWQMAYSDGIIELTHEEASLNISGSSSRVSPQPLALSGCGSVSQRSALP